MKLIIDIPEKVVTAIQNGEDYRYDIHTTIAQGIPYEERPQGEWIEVKEERMSIDMSGEIVTRYKCSKCGRVIATFPSKLADYYPFCHCGADMRGKEE